MGLPVVTRRKILHFNGDTLNETEDHIVTEYALTIYIEENELATLVCSPSELEELVIGFLASEGIIRTIGDIRELSIDEEQGFAFVKTSHPANFNRQFYNKRYVTSCCGKSRQSFYFYNDAQTAKTVEQAPYITVYDAFRLLKEMQDRSDAFKHTGGVHNAALCHRDGLILIRTDIGRHNALDKIYGHCLKSGISLDDKIIAFSGRISSEVLLKVSKIGVGIVLSKSAPSALALNMAEELGITVVGFIRGKTLNVYTHPHRILV